VRTEFYDISGVSPQQLRADLDRRSPVFTDGDRFDAGTDWWVTWRYDLDDSAEVCRAIDLRVALNLTFHYPNWDRPNNADTGLARSWDLYMSRLRAHEQGHGRIAAAGAGRLLKTLTQRDQRAPTCEELDEQIDNFGYRVIAEITDQQLRYDEATRHGANHGAVFP